MIAASDEYDVRLSCSVALAQGARLQRSNSNRRSPCPRGATDDKTIVRNPKKTFCDLCCVCSNKIWRGVAGDVGGGVSGGGRETIRSKNERSNFLESHMSPLGDSIHSLRSARRRACTRS